MVGQSEGAEEGREGGVKKPEKAPGRRASTSGVFTCSGIHSRGGLGVDISKGEVDQNDSPLISGPHSSQISLNECTALLQASG